MSVFTPYQIWKSAYPELKAGELFKIQKDYYMVIQVRHNRKQVSVTGAQTNYILALDNSTTSGTSSTYLESMTGNLNKNRIVHIEYVAISASDPGAPTLPYFTWGTQPLSSKDVQDVINTTVAGLGNPVEVDRWSYDQSMRLLVTQGNVSQTYTFDIVEYEIVAYAGTPQRPYWQLLSNGAGVFVATDEMATNIQSTNLQGNASAGGAPKPKM
jgi:hypothetical protein